MTNIDQLAETLKALTPRQLQRILAVTPTKKGSEIKAKQNARTEKYFSVAPMPHQCLTFDVYSEITDYMHEINSNSCEHCLVEEYLQ